MPKKRILVVTTKFPFPPPGADESDRAHGILQFLRLGFDVKLITKLTKYQSFEKIKDISNQLGIEITAVNYKFDPHLPWKKKIRKYINRFFKNPLILDGAAFEFNDPEFKKAIEEKLEEWKPDIVWGDSTWVWPTYGIIKRHKIPIITRSLNFEPYHFLEENGYNLFNYLRFIPKLLGEIIATKRSNLVFAISPKEARIYRQLGAKRVEVLPLRGLPECLKKSKEIRNGRKLNVFFMGSSYNIWHMKMALEFILKEIAPTADRLFPGKFKFYIFGGKFPERYNKYLRRNVFNEGYVANLESYLDEMDIALIPSFFGAGMQQKIFEPLCRGFPVITSPRGLVGYPFKAGKHLLLAKNIDEFVENLGRLQNFDLRKKLSLETIKICNKIFSQKVFDSIILSSIGKLINTGRG